MALRASSFQTFTAVNMKIEGQHSALSFNMLQDLYYNSLGMQGVRKQMEEIVGNSKWCSGIGCAGRALIKAGVVAAAVALQCGDPLPLMPDASPGHLLHLLCGKAAQTHTDPKCKTLHYKD